MKKEKGKEIKKAERNLNENNMKERMEEGETKKRIKGKR